MYKTTTPNISDGIVWRTLKEALDFADNQLQYGLWCKIEPVEREAIPLQERPAESSLHQLRSGGQHLDTYTKLTGAEKRVFGWLAVHSGRFSIGTIANCAAVGIHVARRVIPALIEKGLVTAHQWNDERFDPFYSVEDTPITEPITEQIT